MNNSDFKLAAEYSPTGDQPQAIDGILAAIRGGNRHVVLRGVTGSGKTFTMASVIARLGIPTLIMAPNKTLAAQLFSEFRALFPTNAVEYFISYYDYYQPEAYVPSTDTYIAKDSLVNEDIDTMRHAATRSLFERRDVIIIASVSCIYGLGSPDAYSALKVPLEVGQVLKRDEFLRQLIGIQYTRNDSQLKRGCFRVRGNLVDVQPSHQRDQAIRVEFAGTRVAEISLLDPLTGTSLQEVDALGLYPNSHYVTDRSDRGAIVAEILADLGVRLRQMRAAGRILEYQRLEQRTMQDIELFQQLGFCPGIENYSRYLTGKRPGEPPPTLLDYFPTEALTIIDESHITVPQIRGMYRGDQARKAVLVEHGFRLPSALDNRPLNFAEFEARTARTLYVSATPSDYELNVAGPHVVEQIIRPTGLVDPPIEVRPANSQVDDLLSAIHQAIGLGFRVLITTLTKRMAEELTNYYTTQNLRVRYLHADVDSLERFELLRDLRRGDFDILVGINLLREGLDLPEVGLVAVLDADKEGFLRSKASLIQIVGRAARNAQARVLFYADRITPSMADCMAETERRRSIQEKYNRDHNRVPQTIRKKLPVSLRVMYGLEPEDPPTLDTDKTRSENPQQLLESLGIHSLAQLERELERTTRKMQQHASKLEFEEAAQVRLLVQQLRAALLTFARDGSGSDGSDRREDVLTDAKDSRPS